MRAEPDCGDATSAPHDRAVATRLRSLTTRHARFPRAPRPAAVANPDIIKDLQNRGAPIKDDSNLAIRGESWLNSHKQHFPARVEDISIYSRYKRRYE